MSILMRPFVQNLKATQNSLTDIIKRFLFGFALRVTARDSGTTHIKAPILTVRFQNYLEYHREPPYGIFGGFSLLIDFSSMNCHDQSQGVIRYQQFPHPELGRCLVMLDLARSRFIPDPSGDSCFPLAGCTF
jgi:hypothetical protein